MKNSKEVRQSYLTTATASSTQNTIALFGAGSKTANHFLRLALDAGYHVRALLVQQSTSDHPIRNAATAATAKALREEFAEQAALHWVRADSVYDARACRRVVRGTDYVVCMMNDSAPLSCEVDDGADSRPASHKSGRHSHSYNTHQKKKGRASSLCTDRSKPLRSFLQILYPLMKDEGSIQVFLYQVRTYGMMIYSTVSMHRRVFLARVAGFILEPRALRRQLHQLHSRHACFLL